MQDQSDKNGKYLATLFKYYRQEQIDRIVRHIPFNRIRAKSLYLKYAKTWDFMSSVFKKHGIDHDQYIRFLVFEKHCTEYSSSDMLFSKKTWLDFRDYVQCLKKREDVFRWFQRSAENVASMCVERGYSSTKECIQKMIADKTIGRNYVCGVVSRYYLAAIPRFNLIIDKFDHFSKNDLFDVKTNYEIYNTEINQAFLFYRNRHANPFEFTDGLLNEKKNENQKRGDSGKIIYSSCPAEYA